MNHLNLVRTLHDIWSSGDLGLVAHVYANDFVAHWPRSSEVPVRRGHEGVCSGILRIRAAFPDWHERVIDLFGEGDRVAARYVSTGTHLGVFRTIAPTGRIIEIEEISIYRIADGRVAEQWCLFDELSRLQQLGMLTELHGTPLAARRANRDDRPRPDQCE